jgi:ribonuclease HI
MEYKISYQMATELIRAYLDKIYTLDKHKGTSPVKLQQLYELNTDLETLVTQLRRDGHNVDELVSEIRKEIEPRYQYQKLQVHIDGAARNNDDPATPNISGIACIIFADSKKIYERAKYIGCEVRLPLLATDRSDFDPGSTIATNNATEYIALIEALEYMLKQNLNAHSIHIYSDSDIVVRQVNMISATKAPHLIRLRACAQQLLSEFQNVTLEHVPREKNLLADTLVNKLLDNIEQGENAS